MKTISIHLPQHLKQVKIIPFADFHIGDQHCDLGKIKQMINEVALKEDTYCILNGDIINNATKTSVSDIYAEKLSPMEQLDLAVSLLKPIKDKILCITNGNHEARTYKTDGIDLMSIFARELGLEDRYSHESVVLFVYVGNNKKHDKDPRGHQFLYTIYVNHGSGGGRKEGAKAVRLADMASIVDTDIYVHSHTHLPMIFKESYYRTDFMHNSVIPADKLFVNTSAMLKYGGYGETYEFKPNSTDTPTITLCGTMKKASANL